MQSSTPFLDVINAMRNKQEKELNAFVLATILVFHDKIMPEINALEKDAESNGKSN